MADAREKDAIHLDEKTLETLRRAKKDRESLSDVIARLSETKVAAFQRRGEREVITSDEKKLLVRIDQSKCAGAESCVSVAPAVFSLDVSQLGWGRKGRDPLSIKDVREGVIDSETIVIAALSCPYRAIYVRDTDTGEELAGYP